VALAIRQPSATSSARRRSPSRVCASIMAA
jgi:hypothetical protein